MDSQPLFSICIPCFNHSPYIGKTVRSVLGQDFDDFEIIVADNASTDNSRDIVRSFDDPRVRLIENRYNIGFAPNLQQVTRPARGQFLNLLSSDDVMQPGALATYAELIDRYKNDADRLVLMSQAWQIDSDDQVTAYITKRHDHDLAPFRVRPPTPEEIEHQPGHQVFDGAQVFADCMRNLNTAGIFCSFTYSRALWETVEGYNSTQLINPDKHFAAKVMRLGPPVIYVNRALYSYRRHSMGQGGQQANARLLKFQADQYNYLMHYDEQWLDGTGVTCEHQRRLFVNRDCLDHALVRLSEGQWFEATRLLAFAWATYPKTVVRQWRSWLCLALLALGPIGTGAAWAARAARKQTRRSRGNLPEPKDYMATRPTDNASGSEAAYQT